MTRKETMKRVADELRDHVDDSFDVALLNLVEMLADLDPNCSINYSCGNIGINITADHIELVDITAECRTILALEVNYNG